DLGLVRRVGGVELRQAHNVADGGRRVVVVCATADEARPFLDRPVLACKLCQVTPRFQLSERGWQIECRKTRVGGHVFEELLDALHANLAQHLVAVARSELREIRHSPVCSEYCSAVSSCSTAVASA